MTFTLTKKECMEYSRKHILEIFFLNQASEDYTAARCCILNGFFSGFVLAQQGIEKLLKAHLLVNGEKNIKTHKLLKLKEILEQSYEYDLKQYHDILHKLQNEFFYKYPDVGENPITSKSTADLKIVDELWFYLIERLNIPDEVKYRTKFYASLCDDNPFYQFEKSWMLINNASILPIYNDILLRQKEVLNHLNPPKNVCLSDRDM